MACLEQQKHRNYAHNYNIINTLSVGDLVKFERSLYSHWGVYVGGGKIIHLSGEDDDGIDNIRPEYALSLSGARFNKVMVRIDNFWEVVKLDRAFVGNRDDLWSPFDPEKIVKRARQLLNQVKGYNVITDNCEHFANWCRYGEHRSGQVDNVMTGLAVGGAALLTVGLIAGVASYFGGEDNEKEKRKVKQ